MQTLLLWTGLTMIIAVPMLTEKYMNWAAVGAILMIVAVVWMWLAYLSAKIKAERAKQKAQ